MISRYSPSQHLIAICDFGDLQQLSSAPQEPTTAQVALATESVLIDLRTNTRAQLFTLGRMIEAAAHSGHAEVVETLLRFGQEHNVAVADMVTPDTISATLEENPLEVLLKFHALDPTVFSRPMHIGATILWSACWGGPSSEDNPRRKYLPLKRYLMEHGFDANAPNRKVTHRLYRPGRLLRTACWTACCVLVECLLEHGAIIEGSRSMRMASCEGRIDLLEALFKYGGDVNEVAGKNDINGPSGTPLHAAAAAEREDVVQWLLDHSADATIKNIEGITAKEILQENGLRI